MAFLRRSATREGREPWRLGRPAGRLAALCLPVFLLSCANAPDWADPGKVFDDDSPPESRYIDPDAPIPNLSSVPDRPRPVSSRESRDALQTALAADLKQGDVILAGNDAEGTEGSGQAEKAFGEAEIVAVIYFGSGSAALGQPERQVLAEVAQLQREQGRALKVVGHASGAGATQDANLRMSEARAEAVARALIASGVAPGDLYYGAVGEAAPLYEESTASGQAGNRRAEIFLESAPQAQ